MGFFDLFKKQFWADVKKNADKVIEAEKNLNANTKTSFIVRYEIAFKGEEYGLDSNDTAFENKPCYNSKMSDGSEGGNCQLCAKFIELNKLYSRAEIEQITAKLGYSVFDNIGGTVDENGFPNCACFWKPAVGIKK
jgi:hypothetical protein